MAVTSIDNQIETAMAEWQETLEDTSADQMRQMEVAFKVMMLLMRRSARTDKEYSLNKEPELRMALMDLKGTYNKKSVLWLQCGFAGLTILGGVAGMSSVIPGTEFGKALAAKSSGMFGLLANESGSEAISKFSGGIGMVGQGGGAFGNVASSKAQSKQAEHQFELEEKKRSRSDRDEASRKAKDQQDQALNSWRTAARAAHDVFSQMASARAT